MVEATIVQQVNEYAHSPDTEVVTLTLSDGETYTSKKFSTILAALATANADDDAELNVTFSGAVATLNWASVTDKAVTLVLWGIQG